MNAHIPLSKQEVAKTVESTLPRYATYRPTVFDTKGLGLEHRQDWHVCPIVVTRDTQDPVTLSNWEVFKRELARVDPDGVNHETHRFGHWGPGWFEVLLVRPDTNATRTAQELTDAMDSYPILDDDDLSDREHALACDVWRNMSVSKRVEVLRKLHYEGTVLVALRDSLPYNDDVWRMPESIESYLSRHYS